MLYVFMCAFMYYKYKNYFYIYYVPVNYYILLFFKAVKDFIK